MKERLCSLAIMCIEQETTQDLEPKILIHVFRFVKRHVECNWYKAFIIMWLPIMYFIFSTFIINHNIILSTPLELLITNHTISVQNFGAFSL